MAISCGCLVGGLAQSTSNIDVAGSGTLYLKILDSTTGGGLKPAKILVDGAPVEFQLEAGSIVALGLTDGTHAVRVEAEGYAPMEASATIAGEQTPVMEIELDSTEPAKEEAIAEDEAVLEGNVTDADTGALLDGASVTLPDARQSTVTDSTGHFGFKVVTGRSGPDMKPAITVEVRAEGYAALRMKNVALASGERKRMPVRLDRTTSNTVAAAPLEFDENVAPGSLKTAEWTYDVTFR